MSSVLITGANRGIGHASAIVIADEAVAAIASL